MAPTVPIHWMWVATSVVETRKVVSVSRVVTRNMSSTWVLSIIRLYPASKTVSDAQFLEGSVLTYSSSSPMDPGMLENNGCQTPVRC